MKLDSNGNFTIKKIYVIATFVLLLLSVGYSFAVTFKMSPLEKRIEKLEPIVQENSENTKAILIHIEYIKDELKKLSDYLESKK